MASEERSPDPVGTFIAILIAVVSVIAAIGAWRVALAATNAGDADTDGLLATVDREDAQTIAYSIVSGRLFAYARAVADDAIVRTLDPVEQAATDPALKARLMQEIDDRSHAASELRFSIPPQYIDRTQKYDDQRDLGETVATLALERDTFPNAHFARADAERAKSEWLLLFLVVLSGAFVLLTLADAIKHPLRYVLIALSILLVIIAVTGGVAVEIRFTFI